MVEIKNGFLFFTSQKQKKISKAERKVENLCTYDERKAVKVYTRQW